MSHRRDRERAKANMLFRNGKLVPRETTEEKGKGSNLTVDQASALIGALSLISQAEYRRRLNRSVRRLKLNR